MPSGLILYYYEGTHYDFWDPHINSPKLNAIMLSSPYKIIYRIFPYSGSACFENSFTKIKYKESQLNKEGYSEFCVYNELRQIIFSFIVKNCYAKKIKKFNINKTYKRNIYIPTESIIYYKNRDKFDFQLKPSTKLVFFKMVYKNYQQFSFYKEFSKFGTFNVD